MKKWEIKGSEPEELSNKIMDLNNEKGTKGKRREEKLSN